jgi:hypothetical protein
MAENQRPDGLFAGDRHYDGPGLGPVSVWKCPACATENVGEIDQGCSVCGSGSARPYKVSGFDSRRGTEQEPPRTPQVAGETDTDHPSPAHLIDVVNAAHAWAAAHHHETSTADAFLAGYEFALQRTLTAPPVSTDLPELSPEGKVTRTIIAALELFRDQVLRQAAEEIASGEWCSLEDVDQLLQQLRAREGGSDEAVSL